MVFVMAAFGAFGLTGNLSGPATVLVFAILGWAMRRYDYSIPAAVSGLLLGSMAEGELLRSIQIRSEEHTSEIQSLMRISYAVFCLTQKKNIHRFTSRIT